MIDIHSHILFNIDDGSRSIDESLQILKNMSSLGYKDIILTPHYILDSIYQNNVDIKKDLFNELNKKVKENNIDINLYLGNEIYIDGNIKDKVNIEALPLNNTNYLLLELPLSGEYNNYYGIILGLIEKGFKIILAHPERYETVKKNYHILDELREIGVLFQCNIGSLFKMYGKEAYKTIKKLLKNNYVDFLSTDIHHKSYNYDYIKNIDKKLKKLVDDETKEKLLFTNAKNILLK